MTGFKLYKQFKTTSPKELEPIVLELRKLFKDRTILLLEGPVGAGKTELVKALTRSLGIDETASPSFAIHHHYASDSVSMDHVDLYRLESEDDLESTGFWDLFGAKKGLVVIEWSDRLNQDLLPLNWFKIKIQIEKLAATNERNLSIWQS
ncbi:tRNA (adenosine(37)-N6)-threonylcarbamoyltransferase complex ATPase subunit type 1 TsaE [Bdellovibrio sp. HCB337]|uniref:tRNA (adenosine(37)-N6)-threonylcarbamoyltransferase complex ATPase subunit type 1 TsaE n=1 Tax=Bdellovibrio sp. HCB337 TaxID=3394358 RepID=UPI0039A6AB85